jgi:excisionase family DNA binding protein
MSAPHDKPLDRTPMWTLDELCTVLRTTPATVYTWRKHGQGPRAYKIGRHLLFADADVRTWLESCISEPGQSDDEVTPEGPTTGSGW